MTKTSHQPCLISEQVETWIREESKEVLDSINEEGLLARHTIDEMLDLIGVCTLAISTSPNRDAALSQWTARQDRRNVNTAGYFVAAAVRALVNSLPDEEYSTAIVETIITEHHTRKAQKKGA